jgi:3-deoxy-D-arabino-heptulosonate 7-phosphate (DAHP) synthase class II
LLAIASIRLIPTQPPRTVGRFILITTGAISLAGGATLLLFGIARMVGRFISEREERRREEEMRGIMDYVGRSFGREIDKMLDPRTKDPTRLKMAYRLILYAPDVAKSIGTTPYMVVVALMRLFEEKGTREGYRSKQMVEYVWRRSR